MKVFCNEPGGDVMREVRQLTPETKEVLEVYDRLGTCANLFDLRPVESIAQLIRDSWKFWLVDDVGLLSFDPWVPGFAHVHVTFWDRRLRGREHLCRTVALSLMHRNDVHTVFTAIPQSSRVVRAFALRVGFQPVRVVQHNRELFRASSWNFTMKKQGE